VKNIVFFQKFASPRTPASGQNLSQQISHRRGNSESLPVNFKSCKNPPGRTSLRGSCADQGPVVRCNGGGGHRSCANVAG
jgi:hypothetical protein